MFRISKTFEFDYGHRVWSQDLDEDLSLTNWCKCRHLHGHRGVVGVELESTELTAGMVTDFNHLNWFKKFIDDSLDHKFIVDINDPNFEVITGCNPDTCVRISCKGFEKFHVEARLSELKKEFRDSFVIVDFVPTSENICKWLYDIVASELEGKGIKVSKVFFKETPKSYAEYTGDSR